MDVSYTKFANQANALAEAHLCEGRSIRLTIPTASMSPILKPGDQIIVNGARVADLRMGDIVLQSAGNVWIAHRLIGRRWVDGTLFLLTKGDNSSCADEPWAAMQLRGVVLMVQHGRHCINVRTSWARNVGFLLALLSRGEWFANRVSFRLLRGAMQRTLRISMRAIALLVR